MKPIFQKNLKFGDIWPRNRQKIAQIEVFGHFLDFASSDFLDFAHNDRWAWCLVVFLQFADSINIFLFKFKNALTRKEKKHANGSRWENKNRRWIKVELCFMTWTLLFYKAFLIVNHFFIHFSNSFLVQFPSFDMRMTQKYRKGKLEMANR